MVFTKDYYTILGLEHSSSKSLTQDALRKAYKSALLSAHPDKATALPHLQSQGAVRTIDDVKEALAVLSDATKRAEYDGWLATQNNVNAQGQGSLGTDFVLGLELLDLSDFEVSMPFTRIESAPSTPDFDDLRPVSPAELNASSAEDSAAPTSDEHHDDDDDDDDEGAGDDTARERQGEGEHNGVGGMEWSRGCRCGAEKGFRILERELEDAETRGEKEVLVGCEGCSLWVRVGFDVEEG